ncbi:MAG: hypothetical protein QOI06_1271 [Nocardioidaceae bacterium]|nr:hypothetical protein [Nocardioidaceae bacterium]
MAARLELGSPSGGPAAPSRRDVPSALRALAVAAAAAMSVVGLFEFFVRTHEGQRLDQVALNHVGSSDHTRTLVASLLQDITVGGLTVVLIACAVVAFVRRRWALAAGAFVIVAGAIATTEILKHFVLIRPDLGYKSTNSLPSGHTTVVASLVLAALLVVPLAGRWAVALAGSVGISVTGVGTVVATWHRPSDVVAALAVTLAWGAVVLAVLSLTHGTEPASRPTARPFALIAGLAIAAALFIALGVRPDGTVKDLLVHLITMCGLATLGAGVVGLFTWMVDTRFS